MALKQLDVRGEICPYPMMKTVQALKKLGAGDTGLEVLTDHAPALETIPTQAARLGFVTQIEQTQASEWRILLTRDSG
jgi:tRNA 2-thiouridine synthesizing protein A